MSYSIQRVNRAWIWNVWVAVPTYIWAVMSIVVGQAKWIRLRRHSALHRATHHPPPPLSYHYSSFGSVNCANCIWLSLDANSYQSQLLRLPSLPPTPVHPQSFISPIRRNNSIQVKC